MRTPDPQQRWLSFLHNHAKVIVASDFFVVVTATFRVLYRFLIHDWDSIFSRKLDNVVTDLGVRVLRAPVRVTMANLREFLDFLIPLSERHLRMTVKGWDLHYNRGGPHSSLEPGIPKPNQEGVPASDHRHKLPTGHRVVKTTALGGLHEYRLVKEAA